MYYYIISVQLIHTMAFYKYDKTLNPVNFSDISDENVSTKIKDLRNASECHKQIRKDIQNTIKPGMKILDVCDHIETGIVKYFGKNNLEAGIAFPTGVSINNMAAHDSAVPGDTRIIKKGDVIKIDIGTHINGNIIDSAYTHTFDTKYDNLVNATRDATWNAIKNAGSDVLLSELSTVIHETIESYEIELNGKKIPIHSISGLGGHNILPYTIHAGKLIMCNNKSVIPTMKDVRMSSGECFAIETFASTGTGYIKHSDVPVTHYMLNTANTSRQDFTFKSTKQVYNWIKSKRGTLPFCTRWIEKDLGNSYKMGLAELVKKNIVTSYPGLEDVKGTYTSQLEHTIYLHDKGKEVISSSDDY